MASQSQAPKNLQIQPCKYKTGTDTPGPLEPFTEMSLTNVSWLAGNTWQVDFLDTGCTLTGANRYGGFSDIHSPLIRFAQVRNEIAVLKKVSMGHKNILSLVDYFETVNNLYLVTDLALGGELFDRICRKGSYFETDAADLIRMVLSAVCYLHDHGIVHRDLKPENVLYLGPEDNSPVVIADFGLSRIMDEEQFHVLTTTCGTPSYMSPEVFKKSGHGKPVDIWAIGVICYFLLSGYTPFDRDSNLEEMQAILAADYSFKPEEYWRNVSDVSRDFINKCLVIDPRERMTAHQALQHPWIKEDPTSPIKTPGENLLPTVRKNFNARRTLHKAIDTVRAINKLREGGGLMAGHMDGAMSVDPRPKAEVVYGSKVLDEQGQQVHGDKAVGSDQDPDAMEIDSRGHARGQTEAQIHHQAKKIEQTVNDLWHARH